MATQKFPFDKILTDAIFDSREHGDGKPYLLKLSDKYEPRERDAGGTALSQEYHMEKFPERFVHLRVDWSGISYGDLLELASTRTDPLNAARNKFRSLTPAQAKAYREQFEEAEDGFRILDVTVEELTSLEVPETMEVKKERMKRDLSRMSAEEKEALLKELMGE